MSDEILTKVTDGVGLLTLNRPASYNSLSRALMRDLVPRLAAWAVDPAIGCVVITGAGKAFCSGGDVKAQAARQYEPGSTPDSRSQDLRNAMEAARLLHEMPKPTIAMVNGVAAGAGFSLALAPDLRIVAESARMTTAFARVALSGDFGGTWFLTRLVGPSKARELYFTAEMLDARRIAALGLANRVVPDDTLEEETMALARQLASGPRVAWRYMKRNLKAAEEQPLADLLDLEANGMRITRDTDDHQEAARAFVEKRAPVFRGS
ncbi:MAG: enoyl-CoA hydratase [Acetobacteraceae bacterium]|nr:enoyl-CoA hydratase [Acetobacteraceae bacterium]